MSGNPSGTDPTDGTKSRKMKLDPRIHRTREALGDAFIDLMLEQPFESITVQQVLDRAGVSRSTFYSHYSDKDDLFLSDVEDFWELTATMLARHNDRSDRVAPVRELFEHIKEVKAFYAALVSSGRLHDVMELGRGHLARGIAERLANSSKSQGLSNEWLGAISYAQSGALFSLLDWWINHGQRQSPAEMDDLFHRMLWAGLSET